MNKDFKAGIQKAYVEKVGGKEEFFVEATVSGVLDDRDGEAMSEEAVLDMIGQFKSKSVPFFPDHGKNAVGEQTYAWKDMMGVWVDAWEEGTNLKAKVRLNKANEDAMMFYNYAMEGMPLGFSIGGQVVEMSEEDVEVLDGEEM
jgi:hypothetical protein